MLIEKWKIRGETMTTKSHFEKDVDDMLAFDDYLNSKEYLESIVKAKYKKVSPPVRRDNIKPDIIIKGENEN